MAFIRFVPIRLSEVCKALANRRHVHIGAGPSLFFTRSRNTTSLAKLASLSFGCKRAERAGFHGRSIYKAGKEQFIQGRNSENPIDPMAENLG